jgi:hypothetical protein
MKVIEDYMATAIRSYGFGLIGVFGARYHYQSRDVIIDHFSYTVGWVGLATIFILAFLLNAWAIIKAERDFGEWAGDSGFRTFAVIPIIMLLIASSVAVGYHAHGLANEFRAAELLDTSSE